jgi:TnpA family transposase
VARRQLLTEEERRLLFGIPHDPDALTRHYSFTRSDRELLTGRRRNANRLGFAVQLALLRHPGIGLAQMEEPVDALVAWLAERLEIQAAAFTKYGGRTCRAAVPSASRPALSSLGLSRKVADR